MAHSRVASPTDGAGDQSPTGNNPATSTSSKMRKRTKTGCLTCRKRRIKCGEERPTCANCIKSKRNCEGYNQRVIFKTPIENWPNHPGHVSTIQYHTSMLPGTRNQPYRPPHSDSQSQETSLTSIQPRPVNNFDFSAVEPASATGMAPAQQVIMPDTNMYAQEASYQQPLPSPHHQQPLVSPHHLAHIATTTASYFPLASPAHTSPPAHYNHEPTASYQPSPRYDQNQGAYQHVPVSYESHPEPRSAISHGLPHQSLYRYPATSQSEDQGSYHEHPSISPRSDQYTPYTEARPALPRYNSHPQVAIEHAQVSSMDMGRVGSYNYPAVVSHADFSHSSYSPVQIPIHDMTPDMKYMPQPVLEQPSAVSTAQKTQPHLLLGGFGGEDYSSPTQILYEAAVENEDDDYWDVQSDEEMLDMQDAGHENALLVSKEFNTIRRIHQEQTNELAARRHDAFLYDGLLTNYKPEYAASPLRNPKTARVFAHFIHVTAPSVSIWERNPRNPTMIFEGTLPVAQQAIWTYAMPLRALRNQGLLHAMLALASLQIARLQGASITPSYKHYAYSLKRLSRSLGNPTKRLSITTVATSLLLAYYEVWTAEHLKWSTHLVGAAQLLIELDFRALSQEARRCKASQLAEERQASYQQPEIFVDQKRLSQAFIERSLAPDADVVSTITGNAVDYDDFGFEREQYRTKHERKTNIPEKLDLQTFDTLQDLYWWYIRHDAFQSMVTGNLSILPYWKWSDCPPRSPLGRADALYGSHDHMLLLIGRIADFTARDRARKIKQVEADRGWRPRPGMPGFGQMGTPSAPNANSNQQTGNPVKPMDPPPGKQGHPPPSSKHDQGATRGPPPSGMPDFYGMAPSGPPAPLHRSYANPNYEHSPQIPNTPHDDFGNLPAAYDAALAEWKDITAAHATVSRVFTNAEAFAPLPDDMYPPVPGGPSNMTPFGPALIHRSYDISILWTLLHLTKILLLRAHPAMPPAAQMAAGVCAPATQPYAILIGRITAGMQLPLGQDLAPSLGAVLTESTMPLFFAGVQYKDPKQREWLVTRLLDIDRRTGWATAGTIAGGCETAWEKAASMGRGPPYERRTRRVEEEEPVGAASTWSDESDKGSGNKERGWVVMRKSQPFAMNLLGTEEDLRAGMARVGL
ncbi:hypothetical protein DE146DRAFT_681522 [Phaeosphaeria sp. MPI-PUGE-AT-0046c]|nr:hypothetical protein DE146DRAFT_681522 [Phaeosphaeria sp. MPI-PUGE-AT-0046c]